MRSIVLTLAAAVLASCGGGNGASVASSDVSKISTFEAADDKRALSGPWPNQNYVVFTQADWQRAWSERLANLNCGSPENTATCSRVAPPAVDFNRSVVVGITLGRDFEIPSTGQQLLVFLDGGVLKVQYYFKQRASALAPTEQSPIQFWILEFNESKPLTISVMPASAA
jgi:hypothetical protein